MPPGARERRRWRAITGEREQPDLFTSDAADAAIPVRLQRIRLERGRAFGDVWLGWTLWRALRLDELLTRLVPDGREAVPWSTMAAVLVLARLSEPSSELHIAETWYRGTALEDLLALPAPLSTTIGSIARSIGCCRTSERWSNISSRGWASSSGWTTTSCCTT